MQNCELYFSLIFFLFCSGSFLHNKKTSFSKMCNILSMVPVMWEQRSKLLNETKELKYTHKIVNLLSQQNSPALVYKSRFSVTLSMCQISEINFLFHSHIFLCVQFLIFQLFGKHYIHFGTFASVFNYTQSMRVH